MTDQTSRTGGLGRDIAQIVLSSRPISWINTAFPFAAAYLLSTREIDATFVIGTLYFLIPYNLAMYGINDVFDYMPRQPRPCASLQHHDRREGRRRFRSCLERLMGDHVRQRQGHARAQATLLHPALHHALFTRQIGGRRRQAIAEAAAAAQAIKVGKGEVEHDGTRGDRPAFSYENHSHIHRLPQGPFRPCRYK